MSRIEAIAETFKQLSQLALPTNGATDSLRIARNSILSFPLLGWIRPGRSSAVGPAKVRFFAAFKTLHFSYSNSSGRSSAGLGGNATNRPARVHPNEEDEGA